MEWLDENTLQMSGQKTLDPDHSYTEPEFLELDLKVFATLEHQALIQWQQAVIQRAPENLRPLLRRLTAGDLLTTKSEVDTAEPGIRRYAMTARLA